jgi:enoyl-CoA hydratase/carnithine racemase
MSDDLVLFERAGSAAIIRLNRENKLNALNRVIFDALTGHLDEIARDESCSVAILTGQNRAKEILLTGRRISAREAYEWGIVNAVTPAQEEMTVALELAGKIARQAPLAIRALKRLVNEGVNAPLETALSYEQQTLLSLYATADGQEGVAAFMEKRAPTFTGS